MRIAVCGEDDAIKKALMTYYGYRGIASYFYNYIAPLEELAEACKVVLSNYDLFFYHRENMGIMKVFLDTMGGHLIRIAHEQVESYTRRWLELKMHHMSFLWNVAPGHIDKVGCDFKVLITYDSKDGKRRPYGYMFNDCAVCDIFHVVVDINKHSPEEAANLIGDTLQDKMEAAVKSALSNNTL